MVLVGPICFGLIQFVLDCPNHFGRIQSVLDSILCLFGTAPKRFGPTNIISDLKKDKAFEKLKNSIGSER